MQHIREKERLGFIGLGTMGVPMVRNLLRAGYPVRVWNRSATKYPEVVQFGATVAADLDELVADSRIICSCISNDAALKDVATRLQKVLTPEHGVVDLSTVAPETVTCIAEQLRAQRVEFADAPVTGGDIGAKNATLTIMVGASPTFFARILPILEVLGKKVVHLGAVGSGQQLKAINQVAVAISIIAMSEAMLLAKNLGFNLTQVLDILGSGAAGSWAINNYAPRILKGDLAPGFSAEHMLKDLQIVEKLAEVRELELPGTKLATALYAELCARNLTESKVGELGNHALITRYPGWRVKSEML